jgi:prepilin-type N-terminal cleavage/methylation domain-containing protein
MHSYLPTNKEGKGRFGFTLIELLIVVAIIAILAAIAVPNFIDAQVRSKVSRVLSDLRSTRTAVESYAVDNSKYPRMSWGSFYGDVYRAGAICEEIYGTLVPGPGQDCSGTPNPNGIGGSVTTPISYMTTLITDPFASGRQSNLDAQLFTYQDTNTFESVETVPVPNLPGYVYPAPTPGELQLFENRLGKYFLWSIGPAGQDQYTATGVEITGPQGFFTQYDPTNGTTSNGRIFVSQKFFAPQYINPNGL